MRHSIILVCLAALSGNACAEWTVINSADGVTQYADKATMRRSGRTVKMWTLTDYLKAMPFPPDKYYSSAVTLSEYDCADQRRRVLKKSFYAGQMRVGEMVFSTDSPWEWDYVEPGTVGEYLLQVACKKK